MNVCACSNFFDVFVSREFHRKKSIFLMMALLNEACKLFFDDNPCMENEFALENDGKCRNKFNNRNKKIVINLKKKKTLLIFPWYKTEEEKQINLICKEK